MDKVINGFSKLTKKEKIKWLVDNYFEGNEEVSKEFSTYWHTNENIQKIYDEFSENTLTNFYLPFGIVPNFLINDKVYCLPFAIEESSVVAAACNAAKFWLKRGGFKTEILSVKKIGQVHFKLKNNHEALKVFFPELKSHLIEGGKFLTANMDARGGGVLDIELVDMTHREPNYFQLKVSFDTVDSMGANFINTVLEEYASLLKDILTKHQGFQETPHIIMSIVSNYTPDCIARATVECPIEALGEINGLTSWQFAEKIKDAVRIAEVDPHRATTHNKGIFNGVDAVVIATGNDFRAVEACGHTYASRGEHYSSLTHISLENDTFKFWIDLPMAIGTVGGLTILHPLVKRALQLLGNPNAKELMQIIAASGLAQNFAAIKQLTTVGIQQGHMKMHLLNMMNSLNATKKEKEYALQYFKDKVVSFTSVRAMLAQLRNVPLNEIS